MHLSGHCAVEEALLCIPFVAEAQLVGIRRGAFLVAAPPMSPQRGLLGSTPYRPLMTGKDKLLLLKSFCVVLI